MNFDINCWTRAAIATAVVLLGASTSDARTTVHKANHRQLKPVEANPLRVSEKPSEHSRTDWMSGRYGLMTHFLPCIRSFDEFDRLVNAFDVDAYAKDVSQTGAKYVIFTLGQGNYFCSPSETLRKDCGNVTSHRDLVAEVAKALQKYGIRTIAYIPSNAPGPMEAGTHYNDDSDGGRRARFQEIWQTVIAEYSRRWGKSVSGWWIDGMYDWEKMYAFNDGPGYRTLAAACRAGNPDSIVSFNDGMGPYSNHSEYGDSAAGEIHRHEQSLPECVNRWAPGYDPVTKKSFHVQWNVHTFLGHEFVGDGFGGPADTPRFPDGYVAGYVARTISHGGTCQFDVPIHMGGCTDPDPSLEGHLGASFLPQLTVIANAVRTAKRANGLGADIALQCPASTNLPGTYPPDNACDGNVDTDFWSAENDADVPYWQVDLGAVKPIKAFELVLSKHDDGKAYRTEMQILASNDPTFQTSDRIGWAMEGTEIPVGGSFLAYLVQPNSYRYLRVTRPPKDYHVYWWKPALKLAEFRVFTGHLASER